MDDYLKQIETAVRASKVLSPTTYSWFGRKSPILPIEVRQAMSEQTARGYLLFQLQMRLYHNFYCPGFARSASAAASRLPPIGLTAFVRGLSEANSAPREHEEWCEVREAAPGSVRVLKDGVEFFVSCEACRVPLGAALAPGTFVGVRIPTEFLAVSPGFYLVRGAGESPTGEPGEQIRFYWDLTPAGASPLLSLLTRSLGAAGLPYRLKVLNDEKEFTRADSAVLYVFKLHYQAVAEVLADVYPCIAAHLKAPTPALTKRLAPGLALAEDPGGGESFGLHRCRILAEGIVRAYEQGAQSHEKRLERVLEHVREERIDVDAPYLNAGARDGYTFPMVSVVRDRSSVPQPHGVAPLDRDRCLDAARQIAERLCRAAIWHDGRCGWMSALAEGRQHGSAWRHYSTVGADLYAGASGIGWFLSELFAVTGDESAGRTAIGAIRQALSRIELIEPWKRISLYAGWMGIAFAAARVGALTGADELRDAAGRLARRAVAERGSEREEFDLLAGRAGAVAALVALQDLLNEDAFVEAAADVADEILQGAEERAGRYSWPSPRRPRQRHLTGFSHGTAGIAYALLEQFAATGQEQYRAAALRAFEYERHWFDREAANWPDFRGCRSRSDRPVRSPRCALSWCHGAPGIALSRLRAFTLTGDRTCMTEALAGLQTTRRAIEEAVDSGTWDFSLCHGLAGNAEILKYGRSVLPEHCGNDAAVTACARLGLEAHASGFWPGGTETRETPGLMLGLAGIGHWYLGLHGQSRPSPLMLERHKVGAVSAVVRRATP